jgi:hypothetical protein
MIDPDQSKWQSRREGSEVLVWLAAKRTMKMGHAEGVGICRRVRLRYSRGRGL